MDWKGTIISKNDYYQMLSMLTIKNDCETLKELVPIMSQPIVALAFLPYYALFCSAINEYLSSKGFKRDLTGNSPFEISDVRNKLKMFDDTYGRTQRLVLTVDDIQDKAFRSNSHTSSKKDLNQHHNLGIFINEKRQIISNTQYLYYMFQDKRFLNKDLKGVQVKAFGHQLGTVINSVCQGLQDFKPNFQVLLYQKSFPLYYQDFNTNIDFNIFPNYKRGKGLSLLMLHILCSLNFIRYVLDECVPKNNIWSLRIKYIVMYYAYKSFEKVVNLLPDYPIHFTSTKYKELLDGEFRSCMMHYSFINKGNFIISDNHLDYRTPFFGLIESRFIGMSYDYLWDAINQNIIILSDFLSEIIKPDFLKPKHL